MGQPNHGTAVGAAPRGRRAPTADVVRDCAAMTDAQWQHMRLTSGTGGAEILTDVVQDLGCYGSELVAVTSADKTIGLNSYLAILKRQLEPLEREAGWNPDPCGRWDVRWWDGNVWTYDVGRRGDKNTTGRDAPTMRPTY